MSIESDFLRRKTRLPSDLLTADWRAVESWIKERAFFMAAVEEACVLDGFAEVAEARAAGDLSPAEARQRVSAMLADLGYQPMPGQQGTIKDLRTTERQRVAIETNVEAARGFALRARQQRVLDDFPAWDYVRVRRSRVPRDWPARWTAAGGGSPGSTSAGSGRMAALVNHPIWRHPAFNALGAPFPPFDFNSGMGVEPLSRREAEALGLLADPEAIAPMLVPDPVLASLNADLEASPSIRREALWSRLESALAGFAVRSRDDRLLFTDPNGTRPFSAADLAAVITAPLPHGFRQHQADALRTWAEQPARIRRNPGGDHAHHLLRLVRRTEPLPPGTIIYRGESFDNERQWMLRQKQLLAGSPLGSIVASGTTSKEVAQAFAYRRGPIRVIYRVVDSGTARPVYPGVAAVSPAHESEQEILWSGDQRFRVLAKTRTVQQTGILYEIDLQPL